MQTMMSALLAAANQVYVLTGVSTSTVSKDQIDKKSQYLTALGISPENYTGLIVVPDPTGPNKLQAVQDYGIDILIDNKKANVKAAAPFACTLLVWNSKEE